MVGAGAAELRDTLTVPVLGMVSGPKLQILAAENLILGRSLSYVPSWLSLVLSATAFLAVVIISLAGTRHSFGKIAGLIGLALVIEGFGFWLLY